VVDPGGLENRCSACGTGGSNPSLSAVNKRIMNYNFIHMKAKFFLYIFISLFLLFNPVKNLHAQDEMDFEEFMGMLSESFSEEQLDELSYQLPWDIKVTAYGYGDFSGDYKDDFVLAIREKGVTPDKTVDVYFLENVGDTYKVIAKKNVKTIELNIEVAFLVKDGLCFVTNRDKNNWYFTSYNIDEDNLVQVDKETFPMDIQNAGK
jgi:hypothetical protein